MECKWDCRNVEHWEQTELIDTLWNVNKSDAPWRHCLKYELIDTLWNVNTKEEYMRQEGKRN